MTYDITHETINNSKELPFKVFNFHAHNLNRVIPMHWHQSTELLYCAQGKLEVTLKNQSYVLNESDFLAINPYQLHSTKSPQKNWVLCIQLPLTFLSAITSNQFFHNYVFSANSCKRKSENDCELIKAFERTIQLQSAKNNLVTNLKITTEVVNILRILTQYYSKEKNICEDESNIQFVEELTNFISKNFSTDLKFHDLSQNFSYSDGYTSRLIKKNLGTTFSDLLLLIRINKAIDLMNASSKSWLEIAELTGFRTYRNLYNAFYKVYKMSPNQFKASNK